MMCFNIFFVCTILFAGSRLTCWYTWVTLYLNFKCKICTVGLISLNVANSSFKSWTFIIFLINAIEWSHCLITQQKLRSSFQFQTLKVHQFKVIYLSLLYLVGSIVLAHFFKYLFVIPFCLWYFEGNEFLSYILPFITKH